MSTSTITPPASSTSHFANRDELLDFARSFVAERLNALRKDVAHCLVDPYAPFPAILFCLSTVDLLGALAAGDATSGGGTTKKAKAYMTQFMRYTDEQARTLQRMFRHKLVHLAEPKATITDQNGRRIAWRYVHPVDPRHLAIEPLNPAQRVTITATWHIPCDHVFTVSIEQLVADIESSLQRMPDGYLNQLAVDPALLASFERAIEQIYDPNLA